MKIKTEDIIEYLEGKSAQDKKALIEKEINKSVESQKEFENIALIWRTSETLRLASHIDTTRNWNEVARKIRRKRFRHSFVRIARSAAACLLLPVFVLTVVLYDKLDYINNQTIAQLEVKTALGTVSKVTLPDGTEVWLNSGSTLSYPEQFEKNNRVVALSGEAYFKVTSSKHNRFDVVVPDGLVVSAYGTEFNVNAYKENNVVDIALVDGSIDVRDLNAQKTYGVKPGQSVVFAKNNKEMSVLQTNLAVKTGWKDGKIMFRRSSMKEVAQYLSRHFNVDIRLEGEELYEYEYSATFTTETLSEILQLLERTASISYNISEPKQSDEDYSFSQKIITIAMRE